MTRPIQYAKHRSTYRIPLTIALTWIVSVLISSPIVLGANYTERRSDATEVWPRRVSTLELHFGHCTSTEVWPRYRAPVGVADTVYLLQRRLHHLLVNGFVLPAVCGHAAALLEDLPCHQRSHSPQSPARRASVLVRHSHRHRRPAASDLATSNYWPPNLCPGCLRQVAINLTTSVQLHETNK